MEIIKLFMKMEFLNMERSEVDQEGRKFKMSLLEHTLPWPRYVSVTLADYE